MSRKILILNGNPCPNESIVVLIGHFVPSAEKAGERNHGTGKNPGGSFFAVSR